MKTILYVCVHNSGRSQMAEALTNRLAAERGLTIRGLSAGTMVGTDINPNALLVMDEIGVDMRSQHPKQITAQMVEQADSIIGMGCGVDAEACPTRFLLAEDWGLDDPAGQPIEVVRDIRDAVASHVEALLNAMQAEP